jgi:hypothetical protein
MLFQTVLVKTKSGYSNILYFRTFDANSFTLEKAKQTFRVVSNETYLNLEKTYANHDIFPEKIAEEKFREFKQVYVQLPERQSGIHNLSVEYHKFF